MRNCYWSILLCFACIVTVGAVSAQEFDPAEVVQGFPVPAKQSTGGCGAAIYENTGGTYFSTTSTPRWNMLDDGSFPTGIAPATVGCIEFGFNQTVQQQLYVAVDFWDTLVPGGPVCNLTWLGGVVVDFGVIAAGAWSSGVIELPSSILFPDDSWCVQMRYFRSLSPLTASSGASVLFANGGPTIGSNDATVYWRDANGNGTFECPTEARSFASPNKSQFYLLLTRLLPTDVETTKWGAIKALFR